MKWLKVRQLRKLKIRLEGLDQATDSLDLYDNIEIAIFRSELFKDYGETSKEIELLQKELGIKEDD